jgi:hypothetical protein
MSIRITIALNFVLHSKSTLLLINMWGFSGRMGVGFTTTCAISAYHHSRCEFEPTTLCDKVCQ